MAKASFSNFEALFLSSKNQLGVSILLILAWISSSDGKFDQSEFAYIKRIASTANTGLTKAQLSLLLSSVCDESIQLSSEVVSNHFTGKRAELFLEMAIGAAMADGKLAVAENHILRFLADVVSVGEERFKALFHRISGINLPDPSDLSSSAFWQAREQSSNKRGWKQSHSKKDDPIGTVESACSALGISKGASLEEVRKAYRRLAQENHPDRFASLGQEAVAAATIRFTRIQEAYKLLKNHA